MEKITTYNYEAFYLDYLEGNLGEIEQAMLFNFLTAHPDLKAELEMDDDVMDFTLTQTEDTLHKFDKEDLKYFDCKANEICLNNVADFMVADVEGEISATKKAELNEFVAEHKLESDKKYFYATQLQADLTETYPNRNELKKKGAIIPLWIKITSAAAVGLLLFNFLGQSTSTTEIYSPRAGHFALEIDKTITPVDLNLKSFNVKENNYTASNTTKDIDVKEDLQLKDSILTPNIELTPNSNFVEENIQDKNEKKEDNNIPLKEEKLNNEDVAIVNHDNHNNEESSNDIKLIDMYKPVTSLTNSYTNLNVSYKKSVPESDYAVTSFSIGKFSFERKRKK